MRKREMNGRIFGIAAVSASILLLFLGSSNILDSAGDVDPLDSIEITAQEQNRCLSDVSESIGIQNPAAEYCAKMGYEYETVKTEAGERGICVLPNGDEVNAWAFYRGECASEFSYCALMGWPVAEETQGDGFSDRCCACILPDGSQKTVSELLGLGSGRTIAVDCLMDECSAETHAAMESELPESFDWRNKDGQDWVTPVKNQIACGSCWAFAAVGTVEAQYNIFTQDPGLDLDLSEQYLVSDCCNCGDCDGGETDCALEFVQDEGIPDEACLRYVSVNCDCEERCPDWTDRLYRIDATGHVPDSIATIKEHLVNGGPLSAYMGLGPEFGGSFDENGIYRCAYDGYTNHAVVIVGYDDAAGCWIVKNSFGTDWEDDGYFKVGWCECAIENWVQYAALGHAEAVTYKGSGIDDSAGGDSDGAAEPGESVVMPVTLWNRSANTTFTDVRGDLTVVTGDSYAPDPYVSISDNTEEYGDIAAGGWVTESDGYAFAIDPSCPGGYQVTFNLNITASNGGPWTENFTRVIVIPPDVHDVSAAPRTDGSGMVDINYNVSGNTTVYVSIDYWNPSDGWRVCRRVSGDVGPDIDMGAGKAAIWEARKELYGAYISGCKIRVTATGGGTHDSADSNTFTLDTDPPAVMYGEPHGSAVSRDSNIVVLFSKAMDASSAESSFDISPAVPGSFSWINDEMIFAPIADLADDTVFTVNIRGIAEDLRGNTLDGNGNDIPEGSPTDDYIWTFKTGSAGCFIATAAYGSPIAPQIQVLRDLRDQYLLTNPLGQAFVDFYYGTSPPVAEFITDHPCLKPIVRAALVPAVAISTIVMAATAAEKMAMLGLLALISVVVAIWAARRRGRGSECA
jgi:putative hemolysin